MTTAAKASRPPFRIGRDDAWWKAWTVPAGLGGVGMLAALLGWATDPKRFAFSYLFAFVVWLTIALGALFFVIVLHVTKGGWGVTLRRTAEFLVSALPIFVVLFVPILANVDNLYPWLHHHAAHGAAGEAHAALMRSKAPYLNFNFFLLRAFVYFGVWIFLAWRFFTWSTSQDSTKDPSYTVRSERLAPVAVIAFALTLTFAAFDWMMSLEPTWYSTIFGVYAFASSVVSSFATIIVLSLALRRSGLIGDAINPEHYQDIGKLLFGFIVFWAYIGFSQMMLIWYANIPEELTYYHRRWDPGGWRTVSLVLLFAHFVIPFFMLISRHSKRRLAILGFGSGWMIFMHIVNIFWFVMPYAEPGQLRLHWIDIACLLAVGGIFLATVLFQMRRFPLIPLGDPRLERALAFENA